VAGLSFEDPAGASTIVMPCGSCRQLLVEAAQAAGRDIRLICSNGELSSVVVFSTSELLPAAFGPQNVGVSEGWSRLRDELQARVQQLVELRSKR
jgi:cytidine deaminase